MIKLCNSKRMLNGGGKIAFANLLLAIFSLGLFSCNSTDDAADNTSTVPMTVQVSNSLFAGGSRALITDEYITSGSIGVTLVDGGGVGYDNVTYSNLQYTYSAGAWTPAGGVTTPPLTATVGKAAAYYPFVADVPVTAVPVTVSEQQDVLYSGWVSDVSVAKPEALFHMQHALAAVRVVLKKDASYVPEATATEVTVTSDDFYPTATLDATDGDLTPTGEAGATVTSGTGSWAVTTGGTGVDLLVIPGGVAQKITFSATIGGKKYTATTPAAVTLGRALIHTYTLTLSAQGMTVGEVSVEPWGSGVTGNLTLAPDLSGPVINSAGKANGVYAVTATGELIAYNDAAVDATCLGVALITDNQKIMIEKMGEANAEWNSNTTLYWGKNLYQKNVAGITETTDQAVAKADFSGKEHTNAIIAAYTEHSVAMDARDMCSVLQIFNDGENNGGFTDWYIPAAGQLYEIYTNRTNINAALSAMTATQFSSGSYYWSSSEHSSTYGWYVNFYNGVVSYDDKGLDDRVRFVRDI